MITNLFLFCLILNFVSDSYGQRDKTFFRKDYHYIKEVKSFYKIHATPRSWEDAKKVCALEAATFFYPENDLEASAVLAYWRETKPIIKSVWIGISDLLVEGTFETVDGKPVSDVYTNWMHSEPNNHGGIEDCVSFEKNEGKLNDYICGVQAYFICKKSLNTLEWNYDCDMPNLDYTLSKDIGKCYKLHTTPLKWNQAYALCQLEQSTLAVINNKREADYLVKLTQTTPKPRVQEKYQRGIYHVGFHNKLKEGWKTVKGKPMHVEADAWFDNYQPEGNDYEECGSMFYTGRLINTDCDMKSFFICEHETDQIISPAGIGLAHDPYVGGGTQE